MVDRVARHLGPPRTAALEALADAGPQLGDAVVGDLAVLVVSHGGPSVVGWDSSGGASPRAAADRAGAGRRRRGTVAAPGARAGRVAPPASGRAGAARW